ncbi:MAG: carboxymuconolactone decarboxylase family protein [Candidatus Nanohaloarchaea archaeon]
MSTPIDHDHREAAKDYKEASGEIGEKFRDWQDEVEEETGFDRKTTELMMLAVASALECEFCINAHSQKAIGHGASKKEVADAVQIASEVRAASTMAYGIDAFQNFDEFDE